MTLLEDEFIAKIKEISSNSNSFGDKDKIRALEEQLERFSAISRPSYENSKGSDTCQRCKEFLITENKSNEIFFSKTT